MIDILVLIRQFLIKGSYPFKLVLDSSHNNDSKTHYYTIELSCIGETAKISVTSRFKDDVESIAQQMTPEGHEIVIEEYQQSIPLKQTVYTWSTMLMFQRKE